jgi:hypothetical protein
MPERSAHDTPRGWFSGSLDITEAEQPFEGCDHLPAVRRFRQANGGTGLCLVCQRCGQIYLLNRSALGGSRTEKANMERKR